MKRILVLIICLWVGLLVSFVWEESSYPHTIYDVRPTGEIVDAYDYRIAGEQVDSQVIYQPELPLLVELIRKTAPFLLFFGAFGILFYANSIFRWVK